MRINIWANLVVNIGRNYLTWLLLIVVIGGLLRFHKLSEVPVSLYWDEVAIGYNSYSILQTGRDEYGVRWPIFFRSFGDYKMPVSIYLSTLPIAVFGLNEFSTRFTSAFLGTLTILVSYQLVKELLADFSTKLTKKIALVSVLLLSISPWHINFSRAGFECNVGLFFVILTIYMWLAGFRQQKNLLLAFIGLGISVYTYLSVLVFLPLMLLGLLWINRHKLFSFNKKVLIMPTIILILMVLPLIYNLASLKVLTRAKQVNIFTNLQEQIFVNAQKIETNGNAWWARIIYNRRLVYLKNIVRNFLAHFYPDFLIFAGDGNARHSLINMGLMYYWELPIAFFGLLFLIKKKCLYRHLIPWWLTMAIIPSVLSVPSPHALRSLNVLPLPQLLTAVGVIFSMKFISQKWRPIIISAALIIIGLLCVNYLNIYYHRWALVASKDWADGHKQLVDYINRQPDIYDKIIITGYYWKPYIHFLFHTRFDPVVYQQQGSEFGFDKYLFGGTKWGKDKNLLQTTDLVKFTGTRNFLAVLTPDEYQFQQAMVMKIDEIRNYNQEIVFVIARIR